MNGWKYELAHPKWTSWSAHVAWGCVVVLALGHVWGMPLCVGAAFLLGGVWEIIGGPRWMAWNGKWIDFLTFPLGGFLGWLLWSLMQ